MNEGEKETMKTWTAMGGRRKGIGKNGKEMVNKGNTKDKGNWTLFIGKIVQEK